MIFLGIGSNLQSSFGNRFKNINLAISLIEKNNIKLIKKSSYYESTSFPNVKDPKFINIVIEVSTSLKPIDLMKILLKIEQKTDSFAVQVRPTISPAFWRGMCHRLPSLHTQL